jgi:DNA-binding NarL/FixJ family response regulator
MLSTQPPGLALGSGRRNPGLALWMTCLSPARMAVMNETVLIVDDHPTFRSFARALLEGDGFEVVGESEDGASAISAADELRPDLVLLDVQLPDLSGFQVTERLKSAGNAASVVLVSSRDASDYGDDIHTSGAAGFVPKAELSGDAIRDLLNGGG